MVVALCRRRVGGHGPGSQRRRERGRRVSPPSATTPQQDVDLDRRTGIVAGGFVTWPVGRALRRSARRASTPKKGRPSTRPASRARPSWTTLRSRCWSWSPLPLRVRAEPPFSSSAGRQSPSRSARRAAARSRGRRSDVDIPDECDREASIWAWSAGAGVTFGRFSVEGRYTVGLSNINGDPSDPTKVKNRSAGGPGRLSILRTDSLRVWQPVAAAGGRGSTVPFSLSLRPRSSFLLPRRGVGPTIPDHSYLFLPSALLVRPLWRA